MSNKLNMQDKINKTKELSWVGGEFGNHKNLVIIGNGFDLDHNMKTKYSDIFDNEDVRRELMAFGKTNILLKLLDNNYKSKRKKHWNYFESELGNIVSIFKRVIKDKTFVPEDESLSSDIEGYIYALISSLESGAEVKETDISYILIHTLIDYFKNNQFLTSETKGSQKDIAHIFDDADVLSFNYNSYHEKEANGTKYFSRDNALYIHGRIDDSTATDLNEQFQRLDSQIKLGVYDYESWTNDSGDQIDEEWLNNHSSRIIQDVSTIVGHHNTFFWKGDMTVQDISGIRVPLWEYVKLVAPRDGWEKIVFFGHSLSSNDLDIIKKYIDFNDKDISVYIWEEKNDFPEIEERIKKLFNSPTVSVSNRNK